MLGAISHLREQHESTVAPELTGLRVLIVHEWLYTWGGAERVLEQLFALMPHADLLAGIVVPAMRREHEIARRAKESWVGKLPGSRAHHRWFLPAHALAFATYDTRDYDIVISVSHAFEKAIRATKRGGVHVSYCLSPPRYLWDLSESYDRMAGGMQRVALKAARAPLRTMDRAFARKVDRFVSLSHFVADRVRRAYGRESAVVYPPVAVTDTTVAPRAREDFLLSIGRLVPYKRVDLAIQAAERLGMRLVVAGTGPELERLRRIGGRHTDFLGRITEEQAAALMSTCAAFVFCAEDDFGIAPLEANARGAPVVYFNRGATLETMRDGVTGVGFAEQSARSVADAIQHCRGMRWDESALRENAERFSSRRFREGMRAELRMALAEARR